MFIDFEKAFGSPHRPSLSKILRHYGIPQKLVNMIQSLFDNFECKVIHKGLLAEPFKINTGFKQGCIIIVNFMISGAYVLVLLCGHKSHIVKMHYLLLCHYTAH